MIEGVSSITRRSERSADVHGSVHMVIDPWIHRGSIDMC